MPRRARAKGEVVAVIADYFRWKAALRILSESSVSPSLSATRLGYSGISLVAGVPVLSTESVGDALSALGVHVQSRMPVDAFLAILSKVESFLSSLLIAKGIGADLTLGQMQASAQKAYGVSSFAAFDELREKRNVIIHHDSVVNSRYVRAAGACGVTASVGDLLIVDDSCLIAAAETSIQYVYRFP